MYIILGVVNLKINILKKKQMSNEEKTKIIRKKTAQQWMPIADIDGQIVYRKDNTLVGMLRIIPENLELLSNREKKRKVDALTEGFNGEIEDFQIFCIGRPVDLNDFLEWLQEKARVEKNFIKKNILKNSIGQAVQLSSSGEVQERRFYLIITKKSGENAAEDLLTRLENFSDKLSQADISSHICSDDEGLDVLALFANPAQTSLEKTELLFDLPLILT